MNESDKKLLKKSIVYLLEGYTLHINDVQLRYYRKGDIIENDDMEQEVLANGIFQAFRVSDRSGLFTNWMKMVELDDVDYFFTKLSDTEKNELFTTMCANMVISNANKQRRS